MRIKNVPLKTIRIVLALVIFILITAYFCDFADRLPVSLHALMQIQMVPAIVAGSIGILIALFILTFLFGRVYCSVICPLGILQDIIGWFAQKAEKRSRRKVRYRYSKPQNVLRYTLLDICILFLVFGNIMPLLYLDPYSNFGRIASSVFRPILIGGNNLLSHITAHFNYYGFYNVTIQTITIASFLIAITALLLVGILALLRGRLFCNTLCPVGSALGLISYFSIFRIAMNKSKCNQCGLCATTCKAECINVLKRTVDSSRCVSCFNCLRKCKIEAIDYKTAWFDTELFRRPRPQKVSTWFNFRKKSTPLREEGGMNRRKFFVTSTAIAATVPLIPAWAQGNKPVDVTKLTPITPPGSKSLKHFKEKCTACHLCVVHCPMQALRPAGFNFGLEYAFKPHLAFHEKVFCNYNCTICTQICPNGAIQPLELEEKQITQIGIAQFTRRLCIVHTDNTSCGACAEHCPVKAVRMEPYKGSLTLPQMYPELCIGCGGCESICPVRPMKAINVMPNAVHAKAQRPVEEEIEPINADELDFGF